MYKVMERFLDNLKARGMKKSEWPRFTEKDDYLVSNGANLFDTIYDLTRDKNANQPKLKDTKINEMFGDAGEVKSKRELPSSITGEVKFDGFSYGIDKSMTSINMGNIEVWTEYFENAIKDFTKKNEGHAMLEDIYKALKTLSYLKSKMSPSKLSEEDMELAD